LIVAAVPLPCRLDPLRRACRLGITQDEVQAMQVETAPMTASTVQIASDPAEVRRVQEAIESALKALQYSEHDIFSIRLALEEALVNAIKHGNRLDPGKKVRVSYCAQTDLFEVRVTDEGAGFDPKDVPDPTAEENLERPCGRGLMLMRHYMNEVSYSPCGTAVHMRKLRKK
jgi:serine/threonine-protein kinase RsbW